MRPFQNKLKLINRLEGARRDLKKTINYSLHAVRQRGYETLHDSSLNLITSMMTLMLLSLGTCLVFGEAAFNFKKKRNFLWSLFSVSPFYL